MASCLKSIPRWSTTDKLMLLGSVASSIVLITCLYCVYYPYLETSSFILSSCWTTSVRSLAPKTCDATATSGCSTVPTDATLPTFYVNWTGSTFTSPTTTAAAAMSSSTATTTTTTTTAAATGSGLSSTMNVSGTTTTMTTRWTGGQQSTCPWFPCFRLMVLYQNLYNGMVYAGTLYESYDALKAYPDCSVNSCTDDNDENLEEVVSWMDEYIGKSNFYCYANYRNTGQVLTWVYFSYSAAVNSILWPILFLITFGVALICLRISAWHTQYWNNKLQHQQHQQAAAAATRASDPHTTNNYAGGNSLMMTAGTPLQGYCGALEAPSYDAVPSSVLFGMPPVGSSDQKHGADGAVGYGSSPAPWDMAPPHYTEKPMMFAEAPFDGSTSAAAAATNGDVETGSDGRY